jgi:hypothetical protein
MPKITFPILNNAVVYFQTYVPIELAGIVILADLPLNVIVNLFSTTLVLATISTFLPSGVKKATFGRLSGSFDPILTEPGLTNFAECART